MPIVDFKNSSEKLFSELSHLLLKLIYDFYTFYWYSEHIYTLQNLFEKQM